VIQLGILTYAADAGAVRCRYGGSNEDAGRGHRELFTRDTRDAENRNQRTELQRDLGSSPAIVNRDETEARDVVFQPSVVRNAETYDREDG
jgi:hypothetical protein